jgi:SAM-dependent methyltransferase
MGFSADWLALREPADRDARDGALLRAAAAAAGPAPVIVDLGCGTGATRRALAPLLPKGARWRLIDSDPDLLARAGAAADGDVELVEADINDVEALPLEDATLVTASALLDLVSEAWLERLAARGLPLYAALNYNGHMSWTPADPRDVAITQAFNRHQRGDKGFGPALGPDAGTRGAEVFAAAGFDVQVADSPWRLNGSMAALHRSLTEGIAQAACEAGVAEARGWGRDRVDLASEASCCIGHTDILARPAARAPAEQDHV